MLYEILCPGVISQYANGINICKHSDTETEK